MILGNWNSHPLNSLPRNVMKNIIEREKKKGWREGENRINRRRGRKKRSIRRKKKEEEGENGRKGNKTGKKKRRKEGLSA